MLFRSQFEARRLAEAVLGNPNSTRDWGIGLADLTPAGMFFGAEEGYNTFQRGLQAGDPATAGLGALEAGLSILEAAPLAGAGIKAAITPAMRQAINTLRADAIGAGRAIARGDTEMLGEVFQRGGEPRSLGAAAPETTAQSSVGADILGMTLRATPRLAELFDRAGITVDSPLEEIASTLRRAGRSDILDPRTAEELISGMKGK